MSKTVLVTGSTKGIGKEIVKQIAVAQPSWVIYSSGRRNPDHIDLGNVNFEHLDLLDLDCSHLPPVDILINNAAIAPKAALDAALAKKVLQTNFYAARDLTLILKPSKTINISARLALLKSFGILKSPPIVEIAAEIDCAKTLSELNDAMNKYEALCADSKIARFAYPVSKLGLTALSRIIPNSIAMCPGWCSTDLGGQGAKMTASQGAQTAVFLVQENPEYGKFYAEGKELKQ